MMELIRDMEVDVVGLLESDREHCGGVIADSQFIVWYTGTGI
jgi:hypothetical protein